MTTNIALINPQYPHNVGQALRASAIFGVDRLFMTGDRVPLVGDGKKYRLPREERLRGSYGQVHPSTRVFDDNPGLVPVAIEVLPSAENLINFVHPENALYVFGPEDGTLDRSILGQCHRFVRIPGLHCLNLASALGIVLYDRHRKMVEAGVESELELASEELETL